MKLRAARLGVGLAREARQPGKDAALLLGLRLRDGLGRPVFLTSREVDAARLQATMDLLADGGMIGGRVEIGPWVIGADTALPHRSAPRSTRRPRPDQAELVISRFISRVQRDGFNAVLRGTRERIKKFKELGKEEVLLRCLSAVAKADGTLHDAEKKVYNMFAAALKEPIS